MSDLLGDKDWDIHHGDCIERMATMPEKSVDFSVFSPPFPALYAYTSEAADIGNSENLKHEAKVHLSFFYRQLARVVKPGRVVMVHVMQIPRMKRSGEVGLHDFRGLNIRIGERAGLVYEYDWVVRKNPQAQAIRTSVFLSVAGCRFSHQISQSGRSHASQAVAASGCARSHASASEHAPRRLPNATIAVMVVVSVMVVLSFIALWCPLYPAAGASPVGCGGVSAGGGLTNNVFRFGHDVRTDNPAHLDVGLTPGGVGGVGGGGVAGLPGVPPAGPSCERLEILEKRFARPDIHHAPPLGRSLLGSPGRDRGFADAGRRRDQQHRLGQRVSHVDCDCGRDHRSGILKRQRLGRPACRGADQAAPARHLVIGWRPCGRVRE